MVLVSNTQPKNLGRVFAEVLLCTELAKSTTKTDSISRGQDDHYPRTSGATSRCSSASVVSNLSHTTFLDDMESLHNVFIWGEGTGEGLLGGGVHRLIGNNTCSTNMDSLLPKALKPSMSFNAQKVSCGSRHAVVVTKRGEAYSWGEGSGGRLGHGVESDVSTPKLIDELSRSNVQIVACGENHTCALTQAGDLYTWGDGIHNSEVSHWIPRKVRGEIEGMRISFISCGPWHSAAVTSDGILLTFGDGSFGALGHGDTNNVYCPRVVEALKGLQAITVSCGVWHTAAIVEVDRESSTDNSSPARKLFTWGNGDKGQLGHNDKDPRFSPSCLLTLYDKNFCQVACGHSMTVALTTSGQVYTMGSSNYGQLGNPEHSGNLPTCVEGKLIDSLVQEISCGSHHVAILTSKAEVFTWGKGEKGQLGHGDNKDRNAPTLVEALGETRVKSVVCGSNVTVAICLRKQVSATDHPMCSACHAQFNFKRKRHNCYNCGLVFCKACSSRKSLNASLAPNMDRSYRVCEECYHKLHKEETSSFSLPPRASINRRSSVQDNERYKSPGLFSRLSSLDALIRCGNHNPKPESSQEWSNSFALSPQRSLQREYSTTSSPSVYGSQATSPISIKSTLNHSISLASAVAALALPEPKGDDSKRKDESVCKELLVLREQVEYLSQKTQIVESELKRTSIQLKEATKQARDEEDKNKAAKEEIKALTKQLEELRTSIGQGSCSMCKVSRSYAGRTSATFGRPSIQRQLTI